MATTLADIARAAGVDRSTVCRVLKGQGRTSPKTEELIKRLAKEMDYTPNPIARSLRSGRSNFVGVIADPTTIPIYNKIIEPIERGLRAKGLTMLFISSPFTEEDEETVIRELMSHNIAGLIAVRGSVSPDTHIYQQFVDSGIKMVVLNKALDELQVPQIVSNDYMPSRLAADHLISLGHQRIAHLSIDSQSLSASQRDKGFRDALTEAGIEVDESLIIPTPVNHEAAKENTLKLLRMKNPPTAIVARYDIVAMGACDACIDEGLSVPEDISITGVADVWNPKVLKVPLTTISYRFKEIATRGVEILISMIEGATVKPETLTMDVELIVRESTAPVRGGKRKIESDEY